MGQDRISGSSTETSYGPQSLKTGSVIVNVERRHVKEVSNDFSQILCVTNSWWGVREESFIFFATSKLVSEK